MDNSFQTSFIPQQPLLKVEGFQRRKEAVNTALVIALVVFFVTLILAGGVYAWKKIVGRDIAGRLAQLADIEKQLDVDVVTRFKRIDLRLTNGKQLLKDHVAMSVILDFLEQSTAKNIGFSSMTYTGGERGSAVILAGEAPSYQSVYFQLETWRSLKPFINAVIINGVMLDESTGIVRFEVKLGLDGDKLRYAQVAKTADTTKSPLTPPTP